MKSKHIPLLILLLFSLLLVSSSTPVTATEPEHDHTIIIQECENSEVDCLIGVIYGNPDIPEGEYKLISHKDGYYFEARNETN